MKYLKSCRILKKLLGVLKSTHRSLKNISYDHIHCPCRKSTWKSFVENVVIKMLFLITSVDQFRRRLLLIDDWRQYPTFHNMYNMTPCLTSVVFFYICLGFLCAQVSSGNCETMESWKICNFVPKASRSHVKISIYKTWAVTSYLTVQKGRTDLMQISGVAA